MGRASKEGAMAEENMRGICFEVCDVVLHADVLFIVVVVKLLQLKEGLFTCHS